MPNAIDLTGQRFGKLKVIDRMGKSLSGAWRWNVICDCGVRTIRQSGQLKRIKSCGCITGYNAAIALGREIHGMSQSPEFGVWYGMKVRCGFTGQKGHKNYVGRVSICPEWRRSFSAFYADMGPRPSENHSIDRINNDGDYEPDNCRWALPKTQTNNRRNTFFVNGVPLTYWAEQNSVSRISAWGLLTKGLTPEEVLLRLKEPKFSCTVEGESMTIPEAAKKLGIKKVTAYRWLKKGKLKP